MSRPDPRNMLDTAVHESAHATAYLAHGVRFDFATTRAVVPGTVGMVAVQALPADPQVCAIVAHAGPLAQARAQLSRCRGPGPLLANETDHAEREAYRNGGHRDLDMIRSALRTLRLPVADDPFQAQARELLRIHWPAVQRVAEALAERDLSYGDVLRLVGRDLR